MKKTILLLTLMLFDVIIFADQKGEEIAKKCFDLLSSKDSYSVSTMLIIDKNQNKKVRKMEVFTKDSAEGTNSFIRFIEPADVKDTKFLTTAHKKSDDEQRLFLPALGKVRRISGSTKEEKFMGSDLSYYDMEDHEYEDFTYKYIKDETFNNMDCSVIEMYPVNTDTPYSKQTAWINKTDNFMYKVECYDKKSSNKIKTIIFTEIKKLSGVLIPTIIDVNNHKDLSRTVLKRDNIKINTGIKDDVFSLQNLTR
ncbi:MAG: outer membrane lipoprotein-sorting protein [Spirochaetes bacterium]|nr:outer membrane lipoprotein-sorting protein [Spirochaetota bacterium]